MAVSVDHNHCQRIGRKCYDIGDRGNLRTWYGSRQSRLDQYMVELWERNRDMFRMDSDGLSNLICSERILAEK
ncbi:hypothetical protein RRG08_047110 [Elysia crispata]|uniref:Uncharacterized protein n=1 Tax=Elysia crispata TaxID=231223 RepID=A0AAE1AR38_9GAST|nr:hypothetical protein RRG08_047110 [Elysia crispata]